MGEKKARKKKKEERKRGKPWKIWKQKQRRKEEEEKERKGAVLCDFWRGTDDRCYHCWCNFDTWPHIDFSYVETAKENEWEADNELAVKGRKERNFTTDRPLYFTHDRKINTQEP